MYLQNKVVKDYVQAHDNPSLREIAQDTGIQVTRVHRILRGSRMKLDEYEVFRRRTRGKEGGTKLHKMVLDIQERLSVKEIHEIENLLSRILKVFSLIGKRRV